MVATWAPERFPQRWELVALLWLAFFLNQADRQIFGVLLGAIQADLGLGTVQMGLVATLFTVTLAVLVPVAGYAADVLDKKALLVAAVLVWSAGTICTGFGAGFMQLVLFRSLATGGGEAFYAPAANALIAEAHAETRARAMSLHQTALYAGVITCGVLGPVLGDRWGWRAAFVVFGAAGILLAIVLAARIRAPARPAVPPDLRPTARRAFGHVAGKRTALLITLAFAGMAFVNIGYLTWMPLYLQTKFGLSAAQAGFSSMFFHHVCAFAGVTAGGALSDRIARVDRSGRLKLQAWALLAGAPFIALAAAAPTLFVACFALGAFGLCRGVYDSNIYASLFEVVAPRYRASAAGLMVMGAYLLAACAPLWLGWMGARAGGLSRGLTWLSLAYVLSSLSLFTAVKVFFRKDAHHDRP